VGRREGRLGRKSRELSDRRIDRRALRKRQANGIRWKDAEEPAREPPSVSSARYARKGVTPGPPTRWLQGCRMGPAREGLEADSHLSTATAGWN
jgi:hypothetical protein